VQVYAVSGGTAGRLAGFAVAEAAPGESVTLRIELDERVRSAAEDVETTPTRTDIG
jgi:beta-glucosidase